MNTTRCQVGAARSSSPLGVALLLAACSQASSGPAIVRSLPGSSASGPEPTSSSADGGGGGDDAAASEAGVGTACYTATSLECVSTIAGDLFTSATCPGGVVADACPTSGLVGCCTLATTGVTGESCFYGASVVSYSTSAGCSAAGGEWTTTP